MGNQWLPMKCCSNTKIVSVESHMKHDGFLFPYRLDYCRNCGKVKATTFINDGKVVDFDWKE